MIKKIEKYLLILCIAGMLLALFSGGALIHIGLFMAAPCIIWEMIKSILTTAYKKAKEKTGGKF